MTSVLIERLRERLKTLKKSARGVSIAAHLSPTALQAILDGKSRSPQYGTIQALAAALDCDPDYLTGVSDTPRVNDVAQVSRSNVERFPIVGLVGASSFDDIEEIEEQEPLGESIGQRYERMPRAKHMAFRVTGDSMVERGINEGDILHGVDWVDSGLLPANGMIVVVEETRYGGHARRWTVKEVEVHRDQFILNPRSPNKVHKPIIIDRRSTDDGREVRFLAYVYEAVKKLGL